MYIIKDLQFNDRYFGGDKPIQFNTKIQAIRQLISYHSDECNMSVEKELLKQGKIQQAQTAVEDFEWRIIKVQSDPVIDMQILTVPMLCQDNDKDNKYDVEEQKYTDKELADLDPADRPRNSNDDYQEYINQEVRKLNSK